MPGAIEGLVAFVPIGATPGAGGSLVVLDWLDEAGLGIPIGVPVVLVARAAEMVCNC